MARKLPTYRRAGNGQAFFEYRGKRTYLGVHGSEKSRKRYASAIAQILAGGPGAVIDPNLESPPTVSSLCLPFLEHAMTYYGAKSKEYAGVKMAVELLISFEAAKFGYLEAQKFGPATLIEFQKWLGTITYTRRIGRKPNTREIERPYTRPTINKIVNRVKRFFAWCSKTERIPAEHYSKLVCVDALVAGRCAAPEPAAIEPVDDAVVEKTLPYLQPMVAAMVQLQRLCGMRPQDVCGIRGCDLDRTGDIWIYHVRQHKNSWRKKQLYKAIPKTAQLLLAPYLVADQEAYIFSPRKSEEARNELRRQNRKTPMTPCQAARVPKKKPKKARGLRYSTDSYRRAINHGIAAAARAGVIIPHWHPNQLRHASGTQVAQAMGDGAAQIWLGHATLDATAVYAKRTIAELAVVARELDRQWATAAARE